MNFSNFKLPFSARDELTSKLSTSAKIGKTIPLAIFALLGLITLFIFFFTIGSTVAPNFWDKVNARILSSEVVSIPESDGQGHTLKVTYSYLFRGQEHTGHAFSPDANEFDSIVEAEKMQRIYAKGNRVTCLVNKDNPHSAYLEASSPLIFLFLLIPMIFVAVGVFGIQAVWGTKTESKRAFSRSGSTGKSSIPILLFGGVFVLVGSLVVYFLTIVPFLKSEEAKGWVEVPCKILQSYVRSHDGDGTDDPTYSIYILYSYSFLDKTYKSDRYTFSDVSSSGYSDKQKVVNKYQVGSKSKCYVNPKDYEEAVFIREITGEHLFGLFGLVFVIAGIAFPVGLLHEKRKKERKQDEIDILEGIDHGPVTLKRKQSKIGLLIFLIFFSLIWNSITWAFLVPETGLLSPTLVDIGMTIFAGIFVLAGAGVSFAVVHTFLSLFNPNPVLIIDSTVIPIGGVCNLGWTIQQSKRPLDSLTITLTCFEESTSRKSSSGSTNSSSRQIVPFYTDELVNSQDRHEIYRGDVDIEIPVNTMHSFDSPHGKVTWQLSIKCSIPKWPDINDTYEIYVIPAKRVTGDDR